ncbi:MAG: DASH family cryptochrome [Pseudanabaenaceae cyanobacterium SKYGB_i_bin29]|nr:DASH family cryptochrome [Pseudanabaenaceae cyanobacterium SKYG29]MDW8422531.1 DASH family cryptochrome [Pseudanabaenaceae cyanobacterium SKYGB_i_bin29]
MSPIILWLRNDLRLHDHQPLVAALPAQVIPVYCFDPRQFGTTDLLQFPKTGAWRAQFLLESVVDLRKQLRERGSDLLVYRGKPEEILPELVQKCQATAVYYHQEVASEETRVERKLADRLAPLGVKLVGFWGHTLYPLQDLPFAIADLPEVFTNFRQIVEKSLTPPPPLPTPSHIPTPDLPPSEPLPTLEELGLPVPVVDDRAVLQFRGGETQGLARLRDYIWQQDCLRTYKETRNGMLGANYSSKFSPWLALGCLSPRYVYAQVKQYETDRIKNDSTYWLVFELLWRDYFRFIVLKHGDRVFHREGLRGIDLPWRTDRDLFEQWRLGKTGFPLVDANMQELLLTGFMSNRGRQNVASFLTKNLGIDWRWGAEWFESQLIDYDVCSNWGNWNYTAGVGNDARGFRYFNIRKQAQDYDPQGEYVKHWLPVLRSLPPHLVHTPWQLNPTEQKLYHFTPGRDYPKPIVDLDRSVGEQEKIYNQALKAKGKQDKIKKRRRS